MSDEVEPYTISIEEHLPLMQKAFIEGRLQAQRITNRSDCMYRSKHGPCVIGSVLPDDVAELADTCSLFGASAEVGLLVDLGVLETKDRVRLARIQTAHDDWAGCPDDELLGEALREKLELPDSVPLRPAKVKTFSE